MQATETFALGAEQVTVVIEIDLSTVWLISGDFSGIIPAGQIGFINGNVNLTGDLIVEGLLTSVDTFTLEGNGFQLLTQDGGQLDLQGQPKSSWVCWGDAVTGWNVGDRLAVSPTAVNKTLPLAELSWPGGWTLTRPTDAPNVTLIDGSIHKPEVANLTRSITLRNLSRIHFHDGAGVQTLKHLAVVNSGVAGVLAQYPIHFHLNGEASRGSLVEGVVVEAGKNHAFVPHGSHGITFVDCVAYKTLGFNYWWDPPINKTDPNDPNNSNDITWDRCLALIVPGEQLRLTAFFIGAGSGNRCIGCVAVGVAGGKNSSGFQWEEHHVWEFDNCVAHNNRRNGIFDWTNSSSFHVIDHFLSYHNRKGGIEHGAYVNPFTFRNCVIHTGNKVATGSDATAAVMQIATGRLLFENIITDDRLTVHEHNLSAASPTVHRNCTYSNVVYMEADKFPSEIHFEDCGLTPVDFDLSGILPGSIIEIYEGGVLTQRWAASVWS